MGSVWASFDKNWTEPSLEDQSCSQGLAASGRALNCIHILGLLSISSIPSSCHVKEFVLFCFSFPLCTLPGGYEVATKEEGGKVSSSTCEAEDVTARKLSLVSSMSILNMMPYCTFSFNLADELLFSLILNSKSGQAEHSSEIHWCYQSTILLDKWYEQVVDYIIWSAEGKVLFCQTRKFQ